MPFTPKLTYKGKPLVRKDNELYYGCMTDPYVLYLQIQSTKTVGGVDVADKVHLQLLSTDESKPREARVARQTTKNGLYNALDIGSIWLQKANEKAAKLQAQLDSMTKANTLRDLRGKVAAATGVPAELLSGDTEEACTAQAQAILKFAQPGYPSVRDGGEVRNKPTGSTRQQFADWFAQVTK